jgi:uncharacterized membrane protein YgcG
MILNLRNKTNNFILFLLIALLQGCASLPKITAVTKVQTDFPGYSGQYDSESKIMYSVEHDSANIYLQLMTSEFSSQVKIINFGLTVYIDNAGRKKKEKYFTFPLAQTFNKKQIFNTSSTANNFSINQNEKSQQLFQFFQMNNHQILLEGFDGPKSTRVLNYPLKNGPLKITIEMNFSGILNYTAVIPKNEIFGDINPGHEIFSIGIKSGAVPNQTYTSAPHSGGGMKQGSGGGRSGGMGGKGGGGGKSGGGMGGYGGGQNQGNYMEMAKPIEFWFQVELR